MSSLISPDSVEMLRKVTLGGRLRAADIHAVGLDVDLLVTVFNTVKPELNFIGKQSFEPLMKSFAHTYDGTPWADWIKEFADAAKFSQVVMLAFVEVGRRRVANPEGWSVPTSSAKVRIYLTRRGEWILWTNYPENRFEVVKRPEKLIELAYGVLREDDYFENSRNMGDAWPRPRQASTRRQSVTEPLGSLALEIAAELQRFYAEHVSERTRRLEESQDRLALISGLVDNIEV